jgi:hypothetical protein
MRLVFVALLLAVTASPALAQRKPEIVIPGKPGVPVIINGIDASYGIVEGEFGLDRPGLVAPTVVYRPLLTAYPTGPRTISVRLRPARNRSAARPPAAATGADLLPKLVIELR